ncbi:hypothetical protein EIN_019950 [Entamoeba invadens IP1]|uniref:hypothetical protein n=1 Tax=Entamoeba invadens IP1 TaxID=370355 RepID=UPI0002C3FAB9|nr:hypothetical protein EIN_019950 [Entamoeba invadens IP1]ELP90556.1 hypothetical protein EIN_019950 [Entamoeba invadens IP1]|eukprot:XP_004257327.1 hypothetical protein EIN_019950 [Entamoeba invadens IP1]
MEEGVCYETEDGVHVKVYFEKGQLVSLVYEDLDCTQYLTKTLLVKTGFTKLQTFISSPVLPKVVGANYKLTASKEHGINSYLLTGCALGISDKRYIVTVDDMIVTINTYKGQDENCTGTHQIETIPCFSIKNNRYMDCERVSHIN